MTNEENSLLISYLVDAGARFRRRRGGRIPGVVPGPLGPGFQRDALQGDPRGSPGKEVELRGRAPSRPSRGRTEAGLGINYSSASDFELVTWVAIMEPQ